MISEQNLLDAFQQVKENHGCAGVDGVTIEKFEEELNCNLITLAQEIENKTYCPLPFLKILVDKGNGEARALCIPTVRDRIVQTAVLQVIEPVLENEFEECSFAFRKGRSVKQAICKIKEYYEAGYTWVIDADIDAFFDTVNHSLLLNKINQYIKDEYIVKLITLWIKAEIWNGKSVEVMEQGIPQGSPLSPILANLFLDELDEEMLQKGQRYVRFADDFLVLCRSQDKAKESLSKVIEKLENLRLKLDESEVVSFNHGFKYLGVTFVKSMIMVPFDRPKKERKVIYYPPSLDMKTYFKSKLNHRNFLG